eukprot:jgi/Psemu1/25954/gm1.25954_g
MVKAKEAAPEDKWQQQLHIQLEQPGISFPPSTNNKHHQLLDGRLQRSFQRDSNNHNKNIDNGEYCGENNGDNDVSWEATMIAITHNTHWKPSAILIPSLKSRHVVDSNISIHVVVSIVMPGLSHFFSHRNIHIFVHGNTTRAKQYPPGELRREWHCSASGTTLITTTTTSYY